MSRPKTLFKQKRQCKLCGSEQRLKRDGFEVKEVRLLTIYPYLYANMNGRQLEKGSAVTVCDSCLGLALAAPTGKQAVQLGLALSESLTGCYNAVATPQKQSATPVSEAHR